MIQTDLIPMVMMKTDMTEQVMTSRGTIEMDTIPTDLTATGMMSMASTETGFVTAMTRRVMITPGTMKTDMIATAMTMTAGIQTVMVETVTTGMGSTERVMITMGMTEKALTKMVTTRTALTATGTTEKVVIETIYVKTKSRRKRRYMTGSKTESRLRRAMQRALHPRPQAKTTGQS